MVKRLIVLADKRDTSASVGRAIGDWLLKTTRMIAIFKSFHKQNPSLYYRS